MDALRIFHDLAIQKAVVAPRKVVKPLILYGAGELGKMAKEYFKRLTIPFLYVVDANPERRREDPAWKGVSILKPEAVSEGHRAGCLLAICVATSSYTSVAPPLEKQGWRDIVPFYDIAEAYTDQCPLSNGWFTGTLNNDDLQGVQYAIEHWADEISRAHYLQFIAWHSLRQEWIFDGAPVTTGDRYFISEVLAALHEKEVFLDGGAHHGEISQRFMDIVHHKFKKIYAVEPDQRNVEVLRNNFCGGKTVASQDMEVVECAIGKQSGRAKFCHGLGYASQFSPVAQETVSVRTLDEMDIPATFIKLHLEGWEYEALQGAIHTLNKRRPILTATTYHKRNGLWQIPILLMKNLQDYIFLLRLHSWMGTGCVMYAIPQERYLQLRS